ncbi:MAG: YraN family protein [Bacteroidales bacterium]|nr:YraN family protein [Bacteroidales bacterium]
MKKSTRQVGKMGEDEACLYLVNNGHTIVKRNWRYSHLEVDIISLDKSGLHFVEVKARTVPCMVEPQTNVNYTKKKNLSKAAAAFLNSPLRKTLPADLEISLDVITVVFDKTQIRIEYIPRAYYPVFGNKFY